MILAVRLQRAVCAVTAAESGAVLTVRRWKFAFDGVERP
jgi:hypothetical protein